MNEIFFKLPKAFLEKLQILYPNHYQQVLNTFLIKKQTTFRVNYLKIDLPGLKKKMLAEGLRFHELAFPKGAFIVKGPLKALQRTSVYQNGSVYVQNVSSMLPVTMLSPQNGEKILDLCASPGAKTTQIAHLAPQAEIVAFEKEHVRHCKLEANLKIQGVSNVKTFAQDGFWARKKFPEYFDKILVDAPCSAEGLFDLNNPRSYKYWNERKVRELSHKQKSLLHSAFFALKEGGELVYSTCTFSPEENEGVIEWFVEKFKGQLEIVPIEFPLNNVFCGITKWRGKHFANNLKLTRRVIPNEFMEAFFVAKLKKTSA
ncbi:MAG: RsmB/NOP family class I SAM-dependent RNA methyltransferase [Candidatus Omnitrophica bacterium]|nr:RsmB/NOP family class I SAM-dependent RNA methyltransferase [Candidatus Omnitrophota bacterium]